MGESAGHFVPILQLSMLLFLQPNDWMAHDSRNLGQTVVWSPKKFTVDSLFGPYTGI
jgi:hypothetical protein